LPNKKQRAFVETSAAIMRERITIIMTKNKNIIGIVFAAAFILLLFFFAPQTTATGLVKHKIAKGLIPGNPAGLLLESLTRGYGHPSNDDIAHFSLSVAADQVIPNP
jgi:hypothetical protein